MKRLVLPCLLVLSVTGSADGQFFADFDDLELSIDPTGVEGWSFFAGDGQATIDFQGTGEGHASILVDATRDRRNVWWALIKRRVSGQLDLERLVRPGWELRVEARIRSSHAPRRVNLHVNTQRTTDFHSHLMEFDIAEAETWHTISMTTRGFPVEVGDTVFAQMALMDWGLGRYRVDVDYFKVDIVQVDRVGADLGEPLPYHPPIPDLGSFGLRLPATEGAVIDIARPDVKLEEWSATGSAGRQRVLTVGGSKWVILRWNVGVFRGRRATGHGLLELTVHSLNRSADRTGDSRLVRVVEILAGDPSWRRENVTFASLTRGMAVEDVFNPQMIIDWPVSEGAGSKARFVIPRPVIQRLLAGRTLGIAITPLDPINASFIAQGVEAPRLFFNLQE